MGEIRSTRIKGLKTKRAMKFAEGAKKRLKAGAEKGITAAAVKGIDKAALKTKEAVSPKSYYTSEEVSAEENSTSMAFRGISEVERYRAQRQGKKVRATKAKVRAERKEIRAEAKKSKAEHKSSDVRKKRADGEGKSLRDRKKKPKEKASSSKKLGKERRKLAAKAAFAAELGANADLAAEVGDFSGQVSGDLLYDGNQGLTKTLTNTIKRLNPISIIKTRIRNAVAEGFSKLMLKALKLLMRPLVSLLSFIISVIGLPGILIGGILLLLFGAVSGAATNTTDSGAEAFAIEAGTGYSYSSLTAEEIERIIAEQFPGDDSLYTPDQINAREVIRYALTKVGYPYDQSKRATLSAYDCSSLAWYSYYYGAGVTIPGGSGKSWPPVAGDEAKLLEQKGCSVSDLKPGDLIFWKTKSGVKNNRHKGIGHVAIYVGNKMMVEAMDERHGVCYSPVRSVDTIVSVCRPSML